MTLPAEVSARTAGASLADAPCFIEQQFPVAKLSMESYKERTAKQGQTLTGLGKWWGRKPLVLVRAALLGLLMPTSDNPEKDREVFLKLMTMDREALYRRKSKAITGRRVVDELLTMPPSLQRRFLDPGAPPDKPALRRLSREAREELQQLVFDRMNYAEKLEFCDRPEQLDGPSPQAWVEINAHLGTDASSLPELVEKLGRQRFGHRPRVGDAFCGGGSIPFESARLGCEAYGSDLNPVAVLLTWAGLNIIGCGQETVEDVQRAQRRVYDAVDQQVIEWGIEHNSLGWRADAYLYCTEVIDPETGWRVPLLPSLAVSKRSRAIARLVPDDRRSCYVIEIIEDASEDSLREAYKVGTIQDSRLIPPSAGASTPVEVLRRNLRMWDDMDLAPRPDDVFQERLYCIRWVETRPEGRGREPTIYHYRAPTVEDVRRERRALELLSERFHAWQALGYLPRRRIERGNKTDEPIRTRGWTHWHQLFTPRQLLTIGLFLEQAENYANNPAAYAAILLRGISHLRLQFQALSLALA